jgi:signal peptidase I
VTNVDEAATASGDSGDRPDDKSGKKSAKKQMPLWQETVLLLVLALLLAIIIKSLFVQAFYIPSPSMEPQFVKNDRILVQKVSYWGSASPSRSGSTRPVATW